MNGLAYGAMNHFVLALLAASLTACGADDLANPEQSARGQECFSSQDIHLRVASQLTGDSAGRALLPENHSSLCAVFHQAALGLAIDSMSVEDFDGARSILNALDSLSPEADSRRLFLLYVMARVDGGDQDEMRRINKVISDEGYSDAYASLVKGIELCVEDKCADALPLLKAANEEVDLPIARGYLAAAYAYSGEWDASERLIDEISPHIADADMLVFYIGVATYVQVGRGDDARSLLGAFLQAHPDISETAMLQEAKRLASEAP